MPISPWHLWGNTQTLTTVANLGSGITSTPATQQLVNVEYARPDTFHFVFQSMLLDAPALPAPGSDATIDIYYDLICGIGRSNIIINAFEHHQFTYNHPNNPPLNQPLTTTSTKGNRLLSVIGGGPIITTDPTVIDEITAQTIQLQARVTLLLSSGNNFPATVQVSSHFAPKNHIRPEWFNRHFPGHEDRGH